MSSPPEAQNAPSGAGRAVSDIVVQVAGRLLNAGLGAVVLVALVRGLGTAGFGAWSTLLTTVGLASALTDLGFTNIGVTRATAEPGRTAEWLGSLLLVRVAMSVVATFASASAVLALGGGRQMLITGLLLSLSIPIGAGSAVTAIFQLRVRNDVNIAILTVNSVLWTTGVLAATVVHAGLIGFAVIFIAINSATTLLGVVVGLRHQRLSFARWRPQVATFIRIGLPVSVTALLVLAYGRIDQVLVFSLDGKVAEGLYAAAYRILDQAEILPLSVTTTLYPILTRVRLRDHDQWTRILTQTFEFLWAVSLLPLVVVGLCGADLMGLIFGAAYRTTGPSVIVLMAAFTVICLSYVINIAVLLEGLQNYASIVSLAALALNVAFNVVFLPRWGFIAAAAATLATELLVLILNAERVIRMMRWRPRMGRMARALAVAIAVELALQPLRIVGFAPWALALIAGALYLGNVVMVGGLELRGFGSLVARRSPA